MSGRLSRMCSSRSCFGATSDGAPISRSTACWFIGNSDISRRFVVPQSSITMRSTPGRHAAMRRGAVLERAIHAAETLDDVLLAIARDLERLHHRFRLVVADTAGGDLVAVADDVVLERLDGQRVLPVAAPRGRPAASRTGCARSRPSSPSRHTRTSGSRRSRRVRTGPCRSGSTPRRLSCAPGLKTSRTCRGRRRRRTRHRLPSGRAGCGSPRSVPGRCCWPSGPAPSPPSRHMM